MAEIVRGTFLLVLLLYGQSPARTASHDTFPKKFLLGFATASYQIEGAWNEDGKGENIWDRLTHSHPEMVAGRANGDIAADSYHKYKEDVALLKDIGAQVYRFSLSWSRILPSGDVENVNKAGITYYNSLIEELLRNGILPMVTLYHWDLPQPLQDIGGWANPLIADYFEEYCRVAFRNFGDRVKWWITFNEPLEVCLSGYGDVTMAPALNRTGIAEYLCAHTLLISHAKAYRLYYAEFESLQKGKVGITLSGGWNEPASNSLADQEAAETYQQFQVGWYAHPLVHGDYPPIMRKRIDANSASEGRSRSRLPVFDAATKNSLRGSIDFLGVNHYTTRYITSGVDPLYPEPSWGKDAGSRAWQDPSWPGSASSWLKVVPWGFRKHLNWVKQNYKNIPVFVTENGFSDKPGTIHDAERIAYHEKYIREMLKSIHEDKCNVKGYVAWSLIDNFEWLDGYEFGIYSVDFNSRNRTRTPKESVKFFRELLRTRQLPQVQISNEIA